MTAGPSLEDVAEWLRSLITGRMSRREASAWAAPWITATDSRIEDDVVWRALERLGAADLKGSDTEYLYYEPDFHSWLDEVEDAIDTHR